VIVGAGRDDPLFSLVYTRQCSSESAPRIRNSSSSTRTDTCCFNEALPVALGLVIDVVTRLDGERPATAQLVHAAARVMRERTERPFRWLTSVEKGLRDMGPKASTPYLDSRRC
jgi:hypothetical protein